MKIRKLGALIMAAALTVSLCACGENKTSASVSGGGAASDPASLNPSGEEIIIRILENDTAKKEGYFEALLEAFNKEYAQYNIKAVDADMDEFTDLATNGPYGYGPDVVYQANDILMRFAADKHILPLTLSDFECTQYVPEDAFNAFKITFDDKVYTCGIPVNIQEPMLFYRKDKLPADWESTWDRDGNKAPDFLENWNDLYAFSKELRDGDTSANKDSQYGLMLSYNDLYMNGEFFFSYGAYIFENNDGIYDTTKIGLGAGDAANGLFGMRQFATLMNEGCIDDTITSNRYEKVANGTYFCAVSTPDTYILFLNKLALQYEDEGLSADEAMTKAKENLMMTEIPSKMPKDGDFTKSSAELSDGDYVNSVVMGGVNGYGISAYTKYKDICVAFVNFATSYDMVSLRSEMLGIAPTRSDVAKAKGSTTEQIFTSLAEGRIYLMPSVKELNQVWTPAHTFLSDVAKDAFRSEAEQKFKSVEDMKKALDDVSKQVYDAIYTLAK